MRGKALRRVLHTSSALVLMIPLVYDWSVLRILLAVTAVVAVVVDIARIRMPGLRHRLARWVPVFRDAEAGRLCGATWLSLGYALAAWFPPVAPAAGILVGAVADPAASGRRRSRTAMLAIVPGATGSARKTAAASRAARRSASSARERAEAATRSATA